MRVDARKNKDGTFRYNIVYDDDDGKRHRIPTSHHPKFSTLKEANDWLKTQHAYEQTRKARMEKKLEWRTKFYDFEPLLVDFMEWHKTLAPNSYKSDRLYMTYVYEFFLNIKKQGNVNMWVNFHGEFKKWLMKDAVGTKKTTQKISYSTANHCIKALNNFQKFLVEFSKMDKDAAVTCECYPQHLVGKRGWEDVITYEEFDRIYAELLKIDPLTADFFMTAFHSGMRFSEILGLPMGYLYSGDLAGPLGEEILKTYPKIYGFIVLESQLAEDFIARDEFKTIKRKPLKTKKKISAENARTIPLTSKEAWNTLARLYLKQQEAYETQTYGLSKDNYALFQGLNMTKASKSLLEAYSRLGIAKPKSFHCCRHSKATYLVGETRSYFLGRAIIGHRSDVFDDYCHIYEMIALKAKQSSNVVKIVI